MIRDAFCAALTSFALSWFPPSSWAAQATLDQPETSAQALRDLQSWLSMPRAERPALSNAPFAFMPLTRPDAAAATAALWQDHVQWISQTRSAEMAAKVIEIDGLRLKFELLSFTNAPAANGRSLFLSLHGGGGAPKAVNDSQWQNQIRLAQAYRPREGIYVAPRAPTDAWNLWHQGHMDAFFARLIENLIVLSNVNPNRVYVFGYSAGGDGVYQVVPRTADRWAAAAMMAGHPNEASPLGLRNVPFVIHVGAQDSGYNRNRVAAEWGKKLDDLQSADPSGYLHVTELHAGKGHWMDLQDRQAISWMEQFTRAPLPEKVVWYQDDVTHAQFYWLAVPRGQTQAGQEIVAERAGQVVTLAWKKVRTVTVRFNDAMLDLDQAVKVRAGESIRFQGRLARSAAVMAQTVSERGDTNLTFSAEVTVTLP